VRQREVFYIEDMKCASCVNRIEKGIGKIPGIYYVSANLATKTVVIDYDDNILNRKELEKIIKELGYKPKAIDKKQNKLFKLIFCLILSIPVFIISMFINFDLKNYVLFLLSTPVIIIGGSEFYIGAYKAIKNKYTDMNVLVSIGFSSAYILSLFNTFYRIGEVYYEASSMLITFILIGRYLEEKTKSKAVSTIRKIMELQPKYVILANKEEKIPINQVKKGDIILIKPGEVIPLDGIIVEGRSLVNESIVTGESIPVEKKKGDEVISGTLNISGIIKIMVNKTGEESFISQIVKLIEEAQIRKPRIQRIIDRVTSYFVPIVISIAILTFIYWIINGRSLEFSLITMASVLVIACPCALGLATPIAIIVGFGKATEMGIIIKGGEVLERIEKITTIVFDKTGTLTEGKPKVVKILKNEEISEEEIIRIAASIEKNSLHPLSQAILEKAKGMRLYDVEDFEEIPGMGLKGKINGKEVIIGSKELITKLINNEKLDNFFNKVMEMEEEGMSTIILSYDGKVLGAIGIMDEIKSDAIEVINMLRNYKLIMITGDNERVAKAIANKLKINYFANVKPDEKMKIISELQSKGEKVMMIGDGINDAPALIQSDVGVAIGSGTDIAKEAGDIIILRNDLRIIKKTIDISKKMMRKIKENILWALIYNIIAIPIAAGLFYPITLRPEIAAIAMSLSSISVVINSLLFK
jgi:Cu+-exporting ATPase